MAQRTPNTPFDTKNRILLKALHKDASKNSANSILELLKSVSDANAQMSGLLVGESLQAAKEQTGGKAQAELLKREYTTDDFRMYFFKIQLCQQLNEPHDWTDCPFLHPGEKARRRDPRLHKYQPIPCPDFRKGTCKRGDNCSWGHGVFECWLHPAKYRTQLCKEGAACPRSICFFAHSIDELREPIHGMTMPSCTLVERRADSPRGPLSERLSSDTSRASSPLSQSLDGPFVRKVALSRATSAGTVISCDGGGVQIGSLPYDAAALMSGSVWSSTTQC